MVEVICFSTSVVVVCYFLKKKNKQSNKDFNATPRANTSKKTYLSILYVFNPQLKSIKCVNGNIPNIVKPSLVRDFLDFRCRWYKSEIQK